MSKIELIESYIRQCDIIIDSSNEADAKTLSKEIIGVFESEINGIENQLDQYDVALAYCGVVNYIGDVKLLKQKLTNYKINIQVEQDKMKHDLEVARLSQPNISANAEANPVQTATLTSNLTITIEQVIKEIDNISDEKISEEDRELLKEYLYSLEGIKASNNKNKFWEKSKEVLKFIIEKGSDIAIAMLPYIISGLAI